MNMRASSNVKNFFQFDKKVELDKHRRDIHYEKINTICQYCDKVFEGKTQG